MEEKQKITVTIGGRKFTFHILPESEERVRASVKKIEEKVSFYAAKYSTKDMQDILSIVLMEYVMQYISLEEKDDAKELEESIKALDTRLDEYMNSGR